jgi:ActR/RegA family two-component response regulator
VRAVIADDDPVTTAILSRALERLGIDAASASTATPPGIS